MSAALPNLVVIGAMKCGTTSLHSYLDCHPEIQMSDPKEVNYFAGCNEHRSLDWYQSLFDSRYQIRGEASQNYSKAHNPFYAHAPERMAQVIPNAKLIYIVRDPVERYASHVMENAYAENSSDVRLNLELDSYVKTGLYHFQLQAFLNHYSMDQIKVVVLEELSRDRTSVMNDIFDFLDVPAIKDCAVFDFVANDKGSKTVPMRVRQMLWYRTINLFAPSCAKQIGKLDVLKRLFSQEAIRKPMSDDQRRQLSTRFEADLKEFSRLLQTSFPDWQVQ